MATNNRIVLFLFLVFLSSFITAQATIIIATPMADAHQLNGYFTRLKRGLKCYLKNVPCSLEDQKTVHRTAGVLLLSLSALVFFTTNRYVLHSRAQNKILYDLDRAIMELDIPKVRAALVKVTPPDTEEKILFMINSILGSKRYQSLAGDAQNIIAAFNKRITGAITIIEALKAKGFDPDKKYTRLDPRRTTSLREEIQTVPEEVLIATGLDYLRK